MHRSTDMCLTNSCANKAYRDDEVKTNTTTYRDDESKVSFRALLHPLLFSMQLCGLYHCPNRSNKLTTLAANRWNICSPTSRFARLYCWIVTIGLWLDIVRCLPLVRHIFHGGPMLFSMLGLWAWKLLCALNATSCLWASHSDTCLVKFFQTWRELELKGGMLLKSSMIRKNVIICSVLAWSLIALNMFLGGYAFLFTSLFDLALSPLPTNNNYATAIVKSLHVVGLFYHTVSWLMPFSLELLLSIILYQEFSQLARDFKDKINEDGEFVGDLESDRKRFLAISRVVAAVDNSLSLHRASSFTCNIAIICLTLYTMISYNYILRDPAVAAAHAFWLVASVALCGITCLSGVLINGAVSNGIHLVK